MVGDVKERAVSCCLLPELGELGSGEIFKDVASSAVFGAEFMCPAVHTHFARMSVIKERLPVVIDNMAKLGIKELICLHDECYGTYRSIAAAYGIEVPFKLIYYMDFLLERMKELKDKIVPLNITVAYQRPCSNRLIPDKHPLVRGNIRSHRRYHAGSGVSGRELPLLRRAHQIDCRVPARRRCPETQHR